MKKLLLVLGTLFVLGTSSFGAGKVGSEIRAIDYKDGSDKIEYTIANGSVNLSENVKFYFDVDLDTELRGEATRRYWDTDWRLAYNLPEKVAGHNLNISYEYDYDYDHKSHYNSKKETWSTVGSKKRQHDLRFQFNGENYYVAPSLNYDEITKDTYGQWDMYVNQKLAFGIEVDTYSYFYFNRDGYNAFEVDLESYVSRKFTVATINIKPELGYEAYQVLDDEVEDNSAYWMVRVDRNFDFGELRVVPYVSYVDYTGDYEDNYYEAGIETTIKF